MTLDPDDPKLDPDTREILRRRAAFIRKSLLGVGVVASLTDCGAMACLDVAGPVQLDAADAADASGSELQVCLTQDIQSQPDASDAPQVCLEPPLPDAQDTIDDAPQICLSPREPDAFDAVGDTVDDAPQVCLKIAPDAVEDTLEDAPQICLSPPAPDVIEDVPDAPQICLSPPAPDISEPG